MAKKKKFNNQIDTYLNMVTFSDRKLIPERIEAYALDLLRMIEEDQNMKTIRPWLIKHGITTRNIQYWREKVPVFAEIYKEALELLGLRIQEMALDKKIDARIALFMFPHFNADMRSVHRFHTKLRADVAHAGRPELIIKEEDLWSNEAEPSSAIEVTIPRISHEHN